jgi:serine/threonine protein kinase
MTPETHPAACDEIQLEKLERYVSGKLDEASSQLLHEHLCSCSRCQSIADELGANAELLVAMQELIPSDGTSQDGCAATLGIGSTLGGYRLTREIHRGGQGRVYEAEQLSTGRRVAIKLLLGGQDATRRQRERFEREIGLLVELRHPNLVSLLDRGQAAGEQEWFAMEFVDGIPLETWLEQAQPSVLDRLALFDRICAAVEHAHEHGVIHCDLKPDNILVDTRGEAHVLDFGLAKPLSGHRMLRCSEVTVAGEFTGTLAYASPEQVAGRPERIGRATDLYSLGALLYRMLTGQLPLSMEGSLGELVRRIAEERPRPASQLSLELRRDPRQRGLDSLLASLLAKSPLGRPQSVREVRQLLACIVRGDRLPRSGRRRAHRSSPIPGERRSSGPRPRCSSSAQGSGQAESLDPQWRLPRAWCSRRSEKDEKHGPGSSSCTASFSRSSPHRAAETRPFSSSRSIAARESSQESPANLICRAARSASLEVGPTGSSASTRLLRESSRPPSTRSRQGAATRETAEIVELEVLQTSGGAG